MSGGLTLFAIKIFYLFLVHAFSLACLSSQTKSTFDRTIVCWSGMCFEMSNKVYFEMFMDSLCLSVANSVQTLD